MACKRASSFWRVVTLTSAMLLSACGGGDKSVTSALVINGIAVPPEPDKALNQATVAGVDSNGNGVRDDVERLIATQFGTSAPIYAQAMTHAKTLGEALASPSQEASQRHIDVLRCITESKRLSDLKSVTLATLDTATRRTAYALAFAGAVITDEGCSR
ncbi:hypothetical protein [Caenimonas soli]|uniref:hypothetical protein n=1 Tax=Caenimonas soli TaxID=2735555 RepID=UPI001553AB0B|nr:hypothetical protein [Caenimonas soli]NPC56659.1 hypothetical protein [Caenimonas soli]